MLHQSNLLNPCDLVEVLAQTGLEHGQGTMQRSSALVQEVHPVATMHPAHTEAAPCAARAPDAVIRAGAEFRVLMKKRKRGMVAVITMMAPSNCRSSASR